MKCKSKTTHYNCQVSLFQSPIYQEQEQIQIDKLTCFYMVDTNLMAFSCASGFTLGAGLGVAT